MATGLPQPPIGLPNNNVPDTEVPLLQAILAAVQSGGGGGAVSSVFGRTGAVTAQTGDYSFSQISGIAGLAQGGLAQDNSATGYSASGGLFGQLTQTNTAGVALSLQNLSNASTAYTSFVATADTGTDSTKYGEFGINNSGYTGSGSLNLPLATYLTATSGDLVIGTTTSNLIRFLTNGATTDAMQISAAGVLSVLNAGATFAGGTVTTSAPIFNATQTWNASGTQFTASNLHITNTASAALSSFFSIYGGTGGATESFAIMPSAANAGDGALMLSPRTSGYGLIMSSNSSSALWQFSRRDYPTGNVFGFSLSNACGFYVNNSFAGGSIGGYFFNASSLGSGNTLGFTSRFSTNRVELGNGGSGLGTANACRFDVSAGLNGATNAEGFKIDAGQATANVFRIGSYKLGTGVARALQIETGDVPALNIDTSGNINFAALSVTAGINTSSQSVTMSVGGTAYKFLLA